ncbi:hypothetical protein GCM10010213_26020 [Microbacterium maritypicum]|uniref:Uncharacterized protein n=2 Tax=Microbacterium maritypicum TaxID=33918 RepID=A0A4Y4B803_MICMQ|nr:hypothetical protein MLI01_28460 [Microbacterium liquefaciens]GGV61948.1 hypothetical protein GCM10010213_26020 [Microbacterium liquefaciens]
MIMVDEQRDERGPVSWESFNWMRQEIARLTAEKVQLELDVEFWKRQTNHWYMKATYSPDEIAEFARKRAKLEMPPDPEHA